MRVRRVFFTKFRLTTTLMAVLALVMQPVYGAFSAQVASAATVTVVSGDTAEWLFNRDASTSTPYSFTTARAKTGHGSIYVAPIGASPSNKFVAENFVKTPVPSLNSISYDFRIAGNGTAASANQFYLNVYATVDASNEYFDCRFDYVPTVGSASSFKKATFNATDTPSSVTKRNNRIAACPATLAEMPTGSHMRAFAVNVGDSSASDVGLAGYLDNVVVDKTSGVSTYDFERALPTTSYVRPTDQNATFRSTDNPVRVKVHDSAAQQVTRVGFSIWTYDTATGAEVAHVRSVGVNRAQCTVKTGYILCDINKSGAWANLGAGTYIVKPTVYINGEATIRAKMSEYHSQPFTVDSTRPTIGSFVLESPAITNGDVQVAATANDNMAVESVNFYMTEPRNGDGVCTGNGAKLAENRITTKDADANYRTALDTTALADGEYCVTAVARDQASNNSTLHHLRVTVDRTKPTLTVVTPTNGEVFGGPGKKTINVKALLADDFGLEHYFIDINRADAPAPVVAPVQTSEPVDNSAVSVEVQTHFNTAHFEDGEYVITVRVTDKAGNTKQENRTILINHTPAPVSGGNGSTNPESNTPNQSLLDQVARLNQPFVVSSAFGAATQQTPQTEESSEVLGAKEPSDVASGAKTVAAVSTEEGWKIFGTAWYWWLLLAAILGTATAWLVRRVKRSAE